MTVDLERLESVEQWKRTVFFKEIIDSSSFDRRSSFQVDHRTLLIVIDETIRTNVDRPGLVESIRIDGNVDFQEIVERVQVEFDEFFRLERTSTFCQ